MSEAMAPPPGPALSSADAAASALRNADDRLQLSNMPILQTAREAAEGTPQIESPKIEGSVSATPAAQPTQAPPLAQKEGDDGIIAPVLRESGDRRQIAQSAPGGESQPQPIDLTPVQLPERGPQFTTFSTFQTSALYRLPARMFFSCITDNSLRVETNVFKTAHHQKTDMVYRVFPNVMVGYALTNKTRVAANYFFFRDQYTAQSQALSRNINNIGARIDHDIPINEKTTLTGGLFGRALLTQLDDNANHTLSDVIPSVTVTRRVGYASVVYGAVLGQIRFRNIFGEFQEGDQFYSMGAVWRKRPYVFWTDLTLDSNFGKSHLRGGGNNQVIILTMEVARRISSRLPLSVFVQAQPIFNIGANSSAGFAGFNFRCFGGLRCEIAKPAIFPVKLSQK
ncbi:MAG: hypothetical protein ACRD3W_10720 [Terriglobales bacterium]